MSAGFSPFLLLLFVALVACLSGGYVWAALLACRQSRTRTLVLWAVSSLMLGTLSTWRIHHQLSALDGSRGRSVSFPFFAMFLGLWACVLAAVTLVVWRSVIGGQTKVTGSLVAKSIAAGIGGMVASLIGFAMLEASGILR
jgi:hypothetical protein